jgi:tyrosine-protein kinase Etk/Wzc
MLSKQPDKYPMVRSFDEDDSFKIKDTLNRYLFHWPLFLLALVFCIATAVIYLKIVKPVYQINASILIKEDGSSSESSKAAASLLQELDFSDTRKSVDNEIEIIKSRRLISQVISDLQLFVSYESNKKIGKKSLYGKSPVKFNLISGNPNMEGKSFIIYIKDSTTFYLTEGKQPARPFLFGSTLKSSFGTWSLSPTKLLDTYKGNSLIISLRDTDKLTDEYQTLISADVINKKSPTISLSMVDAVKERGKDILNHLVTVYNNATLASKNRITQSTLNFIDSRAASVSLELDSIEKQSAAFRSSRGLTDITTQSRVFIEDQQDTYRKLNEVNVKLNVVAGIEGYINSNARNKSVPSTLGLDDPGLNSLIEKLSVSELDKDGLLTTTPAKNPIFEPLNTQIAATRDAIRAKIANLKISLQSQQEKLNAISLGTGSSIRNIPAQEREFLEIQRQQSILADLYVYLLKKREEISLSYASTVSDARVIDSAYAGKVKWPNPIIIFAMAFLAGLVLPVALLLLRKAFNDSITTRKEIEAGTDMPVLAEISDLYPRNAIIINNPNYIAAEEQFRFLRTKVLLQHNSTSEKGRVTLITSSVAREGKAFIGANLGMSLAMSGRKVVIIDLDLRRQRIPVIFNLAYQETGITDYLQQKATVQAITQASNAHPYLHVISNGQVNLFPDELMEHENFDVLIQTLRFSYDDIIIISPPLKLMPDAIILSAASDVTLYVIRADFSKRSFLPFISRTYKDNDLNAMNIVFNGIKEDPAEKDYGKGYYPKERWGFTSARAIRNFLRRF